MELASVKDEFCHKVQEKPIIIVPESLHSGQDDEHLKSTTFHQGSEVNMSKTSSTVDTVDDIKRWTDKVEEKPKIIVPESSHAENYVFLSNIKGEESFKSTNFQTNNYNGEMNTVDNIKRWTVSSSVILPIDKTEDGFNIKTSHVLPADSVKNEDADTRGAQLCQLNEHTDQLAAIPSLTLDPPEQSTDSDALLSPWSSNRQFDNSRTGDSQVKTFSEPTSITDGKFTLKVGHALCRDAKAIQETPQPSKGNSFATKRFVGTVTESSSRQNQREKMSEKSYKCDICNRTCQSSSKLTIHQRIHTGEKPYKCDDGGKEFSYTSSLKSHQRLHTGEKPYKCHVCQKGFATSGQLAKHNGVHTGEKPYKCDVCQKGFASSDNLDRHHLVHTGDKPYKCDVCQKGFATSGQLAKHHLVHTGERPYKCDICNKTFTQSRILKTHQLIHTGDKPYKCDTCKKTFTRSQDLKKHQRIHTGEKPYKCNVCNKDFSDTSNLTEHKRIHTRKKPHKCDVCNKEFSKGSHLKSHQRIHTGEKPYKCDVCQKGFANSGTLTKHHRVHTGESPYKCDVCNRAFTRSNNLKKHQRIHTG